jgi:hypothetical protein
MKKIIRILAIALVLCLMVASIISCKGKNSVVMSIGDKVFSLNDYEFLLSRMKGRLYYYGFDVTNDTFWKTIISADGLTYDDYFSTTVLEEASQYVIADYLFDEYGLTFAKENEDKVEQIMTALVAKAGSKNALNKELQTFGFNYDMLKSLYTAEVKTMLLKEHLYGKNGEKISEEAKEAYFNENYVAFSQIFIASYYYVTDTDDFGDNVYYTTDEHKAIAYDKVNGVIHKDEFGKTLTDIFGDEVYFNDDGRVAYDKINGVLGYVTDEDGNILVDDYSDATLAEMFDRAQSYAEACNGNIDKFLEYAATYDEGDGRGEVIYLYRSAGYYGSIDSSAAYLDEIAQGLESMRTGECRAAQSAYGFHVFCKFDRESGAYDDEKYADSFSDFNENLIDKLFADECDKYEALIEMNYENLESAPEMAQVGINILY